MIHEEMGCVDSFEGSVIAERINILEKAISGNEDAFNRLSLKIGPALSEQCPLCEANSEVSGRLAASLLGTKIMQLTAKLNSTTVEMNYLTDRVEL
jgi:hypothetical protein